MREPKDIRVFFALWPNDQARARLQTASQKLPFDGSAQLVPAANLHLTLHFIGNVYFDQLARMREQARGVQSESFDLVIDQSGYFKKPNVNWLGCKQMPEGLSQLHHKLAENLSHCGFEAEKRPYRPHLTLARKGGDFVQSASVDPLAWAVDSFELIEVKKLEVGLEYRVIESFPLR